MASRYSIATATSMTTGISLTNFNFNIIITCYLKKIPLHIIAVVRVIIEELMMVMRMKRVYYAIEKVVSIVVLIYYS